MPPETKPSLVSTIFQSIHKREVKRTRHEERAVVSLGLLVGIEQTGDFGRVSASHHEVRRKSELFSVLTGKQFESSMFNGRNQHDGAVFPSTGEVAVLGQVETARHFVRRPVPVLVHQVFHQTRWLELVPDLSERCTGQ